MPINAPYHSSMEKEIRKATNILNAFFDSTVDADAAIPVELIRNCAGLAFLTVVKAGMIWTGKIGTGVVIARLEDGSWSPPSGIGTAGVGFGAEIGGEIVDFMIILGSRSAVQTFKKGTQVSVGAGLELAIGPVGRAAGANLNAGGGGLSGNYTYSHAKGMFAGVGLHGSTILVRGDMNSKFYGREVSPLEILNGQVQAPAGSCDSLYAAIQRASDREGLSVPSGYNANYQAPPAPTSTTTYGHAAAPAASHAPAKVQVNYVPASAYAPPAKSAPSYSTPRPQAPPMPEPALGAETKEVYTQVISFVTSRCPHANVQIFKDNCRLFGQDQLSLDAYFAYLTSICSSPLLKELVPKLVRLLPTQDKRERLWAMYVRDVLLIRA
ncbi:hypothetical protein ATCC90586_011821 [Pythium insidiosum]|nr:hypothetical protein ATCC90586_011821 [Pythium insidiosum]